MTIIRQWGITNATRGNMRRLMNEDTRILLRDEQNIPWHGLDFSNWEKWDSYMETTRKMYGHDKPSRRMRDKKTGKKVPAKNTIMYHQALSFLPDECDINGGKLSPEDCMRYTKEYAERYYPNQEIAFAVLMDSCEADGTSRYIAHLLINRSDLSSGKRLDEGNGTTAMHKRVNRIRQMDDEWGLRRVEKGKAVSKIHEKQPSKYWKSVS